MWITPQMSFPVYLVRTHSPPTSSSGYDSYIFVEIDPLGQHGWRHGVGAAGTDMHYERTPCRKPEHAAYFLDKTRIGAVKTHKYPQHVDRVLERLPVSAAAAKAVNGKVNGACHGPDETLAGGGQDGVEWAERVAVPALVSARLLV